MKNKNKLPKTLWENLLLAVHDLELVEKSELYTVDMDNWHTPDDKETCKVCFAGSVMAMTKELDPECRVGNLGGNFTRREESVFVSLDFIREYNIKKSLSRFLGLTIPSQIIESVEKNKESVYALMEFEKRTSRLLGITHRDIGSYENNPEKFKSNMREIAGHLKTLGI